MSKLYFKTDQGDRFEILRGSHIAFKQHGKEDLYYPWEAFPSIHQELDRILAQGQEMLDRVKEILESHNGTATDH
jgi:hypothetical protein